MLGVLINILGEEDQMKKKNCEFVHFNVFERQTASKIIYCKITVI